MRTFWLFAVVLTAGLARADEATLEIRQVDADAFPQIKLFISVVDGQGNPITDIEPGSFHVDEGGKEASSPDIPAGTQPVISFLVIDRSGSMADEEKMSQAKLAAIRFIEMMRPGDRTGVIAFDSIVDTLTDPIDDKGALGAYVQGLRPEGKTACFSAVRQALEALSGQKGRRSVIVLTDGQDNESEPRGDTVASVSERAAGLGVPVFAIGLGETALSDVLGRLAQRSHGKYAFAPSAQELVGLFQRQAEQIQKEFVLSYRSPNPAHDGRRRDVTVRATWRGTQLEGRNAYAPSGVAPGAEPDTPGGGGSPWGPFLTLATLIGVLAAAPMLLKRAQERALDVAAPAPSAAPAPTGEAPKGRVRVIAPTQAPPPPPAPGRVRILSSGDAPPPVTPTAAPPAAPEAPSQAAPASPPEEAAAAAPPKAGRIRILPSPEAPTGASAPAPEAPATPPSEAPPSTP